jgi:peptide deformylase
MILKLAYYGDPILRKKVAPIASVTEEIRTFAKDLIQTMQALPNGVGLAAPQVHKSLAIFVVQFPDKNSTDKWIPGPIEVFINPKLIAVSDEIWSYSEGCLSIPGIYEEVPRPVQIQIQGQDLNGDTFVRTYVGYEARMLLHENDHLNGVLFIDRIDKERRRAIESGLRAIKKKFSQKK